MEREASFARGLSHFDAVWARVTGQRSVAGAAAAEGLRLMPRGKRRGRKCRGGR